MHVKRKDMMDLHGKLEFQIRLKLSAFLVAYCFSIKHFPSKSVKI